MHLTPAAQTLQGRVTRPLLFWGWMLVKLPAALWVGVRLKALTPERCVATVPYGWRSQNPFQSTYFAAQAMAAELSTGALTLLAAANAGVPFATLIVDMKATFGKKATGTVTFTCEQGADVFAAVEAAKASGEARTVTVETVGRLDDGVEASRFRFTWSVKPRTQR